MQQRMLEFARKVSVALVAVFVASVVRAFFHEIFDETIPYTPFYPAIVVATMYGRLTGGLVATFVGGFAAAFWIYPFGQPLIQESTDLIGLALFLLVSGIVVALCEAMLRARERAEIAAAERQAALESEHAARQQAEEANRLKDQFLASVSHELRTPLQAILGWAHLLARDGCSNPERAEGLEVIERNARMQSRLIEDLLDLSRIRAGKLRLAPRLVNPQQPIEAAIQTVAPAAQAKNVAIERQYDDHVNVLRADPDRLQQIVWNLLSNSIKFSPPGSRVCVTVRKAGPEVEIEVCDEGEGIEPEVLDRVFERFCQLHTDRARRHGGLGLGLSIVKHLAELHGGSVRAASKGRGQGTTVTVALPALPAAMEDPLSDADRGRAAGDELRGVRVLVVDDDQVTCDLVRRILAARKAEVAVAGGVEEAIELLDRFQPDVLVSDIGLPGRDGWELMREIRQRLGRPPQNRLAAMALTAYTSAEDQRRSFEAGYRLHMAKPVEPQSLADAVGELAASSGRV